MIFWLYPSLGGMEYVSPVVCPALSAHAGAHTATLTHTILPFMPHFAVCFYLTDNTST